MPISCSDAHTIENIFKPKDNTSYLKLSQIHKLSEHELLTQIKEKALRYGETRTTYKKPSEVTTWIEGIEIIPESNEYSNFWPFKKHNSSDEESFILSFTRNLNCLIGGRGSGKSAMLDALSFSYEHDEVSKIAKELKTKDNKSNKYDWYKRSRATLEGCSVRICWKSIGLTGFDLLEKRSLFEKRYFDPNQKFLDAKLTDLSGNEILKSALEMPRISLYRIHEIETTSSSEHLIALFDQICGEDITRLNEEIKNIQDSLEENRNKLVDISGDISNLTEEDSPLREYITRKKQFLEVNKKEVRDKYEIIDQASKAEKIAENAFEEWEEIDNDISFDDINTNVEEYFDDLKKIIKDDKENTYKFCEPLEEVLVYKNAEDEKVSRKTLITGVISKVKNEFHNITDNLKSIHNDIKKTHTEKKNDLEQEGLPAGSSDREAKKKALDEANQDLKKYRKLLSEWKNVYKKRLKLHGILVDVCKQRSDLRKLTAESLTHDLAKDLDSTVLVIEADAQIMSDRNGFIDWMEEVVKPHLSRYKAQRITALVNNNIMPADLRDLLLSFNDIKPDILFIDKEKASDGKISEDDAQEIINNCIGRIVISPELELGDEDEDFIKDLPIEIKTGLLYFPWENDEEYLRLHNVLSLDEIVFNDIPVIRLNDRPSEKGSVARDISELSPGQRCSAILPILLLNGSNPIIIDQPEDNLDNRLIRQVIINILASMKLHRQVIIATHNPNLPVLGDVEQAIILRAVEESECKLEAVGDLDSKNIVKHITDIMEGGREAFQFRHTIYQSHWKGPIE